MTKNCIVCGGSASQTKEISIAEIHHSLSSLLGVALRDGLIVTDYTLYKCNDCKLEFSDPLLEGNSEFYNELSKIEGYYPQRRWEWDAAENLIKEFVKKNENRVTRLIDVGCGDGKFLKKISSINFVDPIGLDFASDSIRKCLEQNLSAYCCDLNTAKKILKGKVSVITAFHVLEHIADPLKFIFECGNLLEEDGILILATPYSPMSIEENWHDPLNHPPHHLSRWNNCSYISLANKSGFNVYFYYPKTRNMFIRAIHAVQLRVVSSFKNHGKLNRVLNTLIYILKNPLIFLKELISQYRRVKINSITAPDSVVVVFTKNENH
jgi:SAM-dependent methyltransferase